MLTSKKGRIYWNQFYLGTQYTCFVIAVIFSLYFLDYCQCHALLPILNFLPTGHSSNIEHTTIRHFLWFSPASWVQLFWFEPKMYMVPIVPPFLPTSEQYFPQKLSGQFQKCPSYSTACSSVAVSTKSPWICQKCCRNPMKFQVLQFSVSDPISFKYFMLPPYCVFNASSFCWGWVWTVFTEHPQLLSLLARTSWNQTALHDELHCKYNLTKPWHLA